MCYSTQLGMPGLTWSNTVFPPSPLPLSLPLPVPCLSKIWRDGVGLKFIKSKVLHGFGPWDPQSKLGVYYAQ